MSRHDELNTVLWFAARAAKYYFITWLMPGSGMMKQILRYIEVVFDLPVTLASTSEKQLKFAEST